MAVESATTINQLNESNPQATDLKSEGDNHIRLLKSTIKTTFPNITGAVTPTHVQLNFVAGVTSSIQDQLNRTLRQSGGSTVNAIPDAATRASKVLSFDASGHPVTTIATVDLSNAVTAAATATTQAGIATTQAGIATTQAGIATTKAAEAAASAASIAGGPVASVNGRTGVVTGVQDTLVSGTSIKTVNSTSLLGSGDVAVQATLVSGTNIKTIGGVSVLGSGNIALSSGLTLLSTISPTAAANVDALSIFSSSYDNYLVVFEGIKPAADDSLACRFAVSGVVDTGTVYFSNTNTSGSTNGIGRLVISGTFLASGVGGGGVFNIQNANDATNAKTGSSSMIGQDSATPTFSIHRSSHGYRAANAISGVRFYWQSGSNFAATGVIRIYGYANA